MNSWPTLAEYEKYENDVISSLGLHSASFLPANAMRERHASFRLRYTDAGGAGGQPALTNPAREALMKMLSEQHDVFVKFYKCMQAKTTKPDPAPICQKTTSVNDVLRRLNVLHTLTPAEMPSMQQACVHYLKDKCSVVPTSTPNDVQAACSLSCTDYRFAQELENDVKKAATLHCLSILQQRPSSTPPTAQPRTTNSFKGAEADVSTTGEDNDRIRIGDVIEDVAEDYPNVDWYDRDVEGDIKMKVGMMMSSQERRKRIKRKRDELGARVYVEGDRENIKACIGKAVSLYLKKTK